jgi:uracil-DNA glycosylase
MQTDHQANLAFDFPEAVNTSSPRQLQAWTPEKWPVAADWQASVDAFFNSPTGHQLGAFVAQRLSEGAVVYPPHPLRALALTPLHAVRVVILGQDPYHGPGQAEGLAFSVAPGVKTPPSLRNIFKELQREALLPALPSNGSLQAWAEAGVLLLNTSLTVEDGQPASHAKRGWEVFTDGILSTVAAQAPACVYLLWGAHAQAKAPLIEQTARQHGRKALLLQSNHPSPLSASRPPVPFLGCNHFLQSQAWLQDQNIAIDWQLLPRD